MSRGAELLFLRMYTYKNKIKADDGSAVEKVCNGAKVSDFIPALSASLRNFLRGVSIVQPIFNVPRSLKVVAYILIS